ncbi:MAG: surface lipoprotein assembly modifier [bacterium]
MFISRCTLASDLTGRGDIKWQRTDQVNPGYSDRGSDFIYVLGGEVRLKGRPFERSRAEIRLGAETRLYSKFGRNNNQRYFAGLRSSAARTSLRLKYEFIPRRLYFPSSEGDATYSRNLLKIELSQEFLEDWEVSLGYEVRWEDFIQMHDRRDNRTNIAETQLEYGLSRLLRPSIAFEWRNRNAENDNYDYTSQRIAFSLKSHPTQRLGLRLGYDVGDRRYLTPHMRDSNHRRIDARTGLSAEGRITLLKMLELILGYERREKDSSREEEERSYTVNTFSVGARLKLEP